MVLRTSIPFRIDRRFEDCFKRVVNTSKELRVNGVPWGAAEARTLALGASPDARAFHTILTTMAETTTRCRYGG